VQKLSSSIYRGLAHEGLTRDIDQFNAGLFRNEHSSRDHIDNPQQITSCPSHSSSIDRHATRIPTLTTDIHFGMGPADGNIERRDARRRRE
jgi:hypothetical protein